MNAVISLMEIGGIGTGSQSADDLGPRGRTPLRLILTPREPVLAHTPATGAVIAAGGAHAAVRPATFTDLRRDTLVRSMLGTPAGAWVFVTFTEFSFDSMAHDELRDEERSGGFDNDADDDTFVRPSPVNTATVGASPSVPPPAMSHAAPRRSRFPFKTILVGLPLVCLLAAMVILFRGRHSTPAAPVIEVGRQSSTGTVVNMQPPVESAQPAPTPAALAPASPASQPASAAPVPPVTAPQASLPSAGAPPPAATAGHGTYEIQVVATPNRAEADRRVAALTARGAHAFIKTVDRDGATLYRVRLGGYASEAAAQADRDKLGLHSTWIERTGR